mmetsp:Transcript_19889/g.36684  ORF Transcript_19889/g.36684 Transcript_19889/m.36684 type:complete len:648 (-) Transcript_19889:4500-6443(-)
MSDSSTEETPLKDKPAMSGTSSTRKTAPSLASPFPASKYKYLAVWRRAYFRIRLKKALSSLNNEIIIYGTSNEVFDVGTYEEIMKAKKMKEKKTTTVNVALHWYLLSPNSPYLYIWNIIIGLLLIYTATLMPYRIAFSDPVYFDAFTIFETVVDFLFIKDILVNCVTTYKTDKGVYEKSFRLIFLSYLKTWFIIDVVSSFPMGLVEYSMGLDPDKSNNKANRFARLARLPRLYKLLRILRISKLSRVYKGNPFYEKIEDWFDVNGRFLRFFKFILTIALFVHFFACFFYFAARMEGLSTDTWVFQLGYQDKTKGSLYLISFYWAFTTIATVGYGDIHAYTEVEMVVCITAMAVGVGVYSMIISSITSLLSSIDVREAEISNKVKAANDFGEEAGLNRETINKIRQVITYNASVFSVDNIRILESLPKTLKFEVVLQMYNGIAKCMPLFMKKDSSFLVFVMPRLKPLLLEAYEEVYEEDDSSEDMFIILKGRVSFILGKNADYKCYLKGTNFGEVEILANCKRIDTAIVMINTELLVMTKQSFNEMLDEFPSEKIQLRMIAIERLKRNHGAKVNAMRMLKRSAADIEAEKNKHYEILMAFETAEKIVNQNKSLVRLQTLDRELYETLGHLEECVRDLNASRPVSRGKR